MNTTPLSLSQVSIIPLAKRMEWVGVVASWLFECWPEAFEHEKEQSVDRVLERCRVDTIPMTLVACFEERPIGTVSLSEDTGPKLFFPDEALVPTLSGLYVVPDWRMVGIGSLLCRSVLELAREQGHSPLYLYTLESEYYRRAGWEMLDETSGCMIHRTFEA